MDRHEGETVNAYPLLYLVLLVAVGVAALRAVRLDRADRWAEFHLMHGPQSGCAECVDK